LAPEGVVIFGHYDPQPELAAQLGLPRPTLGRFVSAQIALCSKGDPEPHIELSGRHWRLARPGEAPQPAPTLPNQGQDTD
jgi:hypothetical protein